MKKQNKKVDFFQCYQEHQLLAYQANALPERGPIRAGEGTIKAAQSFKPPHPLANLEIKKYYQKEEV